MTDHRGKDPIDHLRISANEGNVVASSVVRAALAQVAEIVASRNRLAAECMAYRSWESELHTLGWDLSDKSKCQAAINAARAAVDEHGDLGA